MKPEIRLQLLKEYNRIEKTSNSKVHFGFVAGIFLSLLYFTFRIADGKTDKFIYLFVFGSIMLLQIYAFTKFMFEKKLYLILNAMLNKTDETIQKEKEEINGID